MQIIWNKLFIKALLTISIFLPKQSETPVILTSFMSLNVSANKAESPQSWNYLLSVLKTWISRYWMAETVIHSLTGPWWLGGEVWASILQKSCGDFAHSHKARPWVIRILGVAPSALVPEVSALEEAGTIRGREWAIHILNYLYNFSTSQSCGSVTLSSNYEPIVRVGYF